MEPRRPMPDEDRARTGENPDLGRGDDRERTRDERRDDRMPREERRPETADERNEAGEERRAEPPTITPADATPTDDPGTSPI
jgi:hypothetical protein